MNYNVLLGARLPAATVRCLLGEMERQGVAPDERTYAGAINALARRRGGFGAAQELWDDMQARGVAPTPYTWCALVSAAAEEGRREVARLVDQLGEVRGATATARDNLGAEAEARQRDVVRLENRLNADQAAASESISQLRHRLDSLAAASENIHRAEDAAGQVREVVPDSPAREQALADIRADARITETALTRLVESTAVTTQQAALREARAALAAESADLRRRHHRQAGPAPWQAFCARAPRSR
mgnify:CR=1 FL=1